MVTEGWTHFNVSFQGSNIARLKWAKADLGRISRLLYNLNAEVGTTYTRELVGALADEVGSLCTPIHNFSQADSLHTKYVKSGD